MLGCGKTYYMSKSYKDNSNTLEDKLRGLIINTVVSLSCSQLEAGNTSVKDEVT